MTDSLKSSNKELQIVFAKKTGAWFLLNYKPDQYGRFLGCGNDSYFFDMRSGYRQYSDYRRCGFRYRRFEKYCVEQNIYFNPTELHLMKRGESLYHLLSLCMVLGTFYYTFDYLDYNYTTGPYPFPQNLTGPRSAKFILPFIVADFVVSLHIRSKAERRFRKNWNHE